MSTNSLPDWAQKLKAAYENGYSDVEVMAENNWSEEDFKAYMEQPAFARLIEQGRLKHKAFWVSQIRKNLNNRTFNSSGYALYMKNMFGWAEKQETNNKDLTKDVSTLTTDELRAEYEKATKAVGLVNKAAAK